MSATRLLYGLILVFLFTSMLSGCAREKAPKNDRYCLTLDLKPDEALMQEYKGLHTHEGAWKEIPIGIRDSGCRDMEIYLQNNRMFLIVEIAAGASLDSVWQAMENQPRQSEWAEFIWQFQQSVPGAQAGEKWVLMEKVFDLDDHQ